MVQNFLARWLCCPGGRAVSGPADFVGVVFLHDGFLDFERVASVDFAELAPEDFMAGAFETDPAHARALAGSAPGRPRSAATSPSVISNSSSTAVTTSGALVTPASSSRIQRGSDVGASLPGSNVSSLRTGSSSDCGKRRVTGAAPAGRVDRHARRDRRRVAPPEHIDVAQALQALEREIEAAVLRESLVERLSQMPCELGDEGAFDIRSSSDGTRRGAPPRASPPKIDATIVSAIRSSKTISMRVSIGGAVQHRGGQALATRPRNSKTWVDRISSTVPDEDALQNEASASGALSENCSSA